MSGGGNKCQISRLIVSLKKQLPTGVENITAECSAPIFSRQFSTSSRDVDTWRQPAFGFDDLVLSIQVTGHCDK